MQTQEQVALVQTLSEAITQKIVDDINAGRIPVDWDGHELRQLLADRFARQTTSMGQSRKRDYNNTVLVKNL